MQLQPSVDQDDGLRSLSCRSKDEYNFFQLLGIATSVPKSQTTLNKARLRAHERKIKTTQSRQRPRAVDQNPPRIAIALPLNGEGLLRARFTELVQYRHLNAWGLVLAPRHIGHDPALDSAASAFYHMWCFHQSSRAESKHKALATYASAVQELRQALASSRFYSPCVLLAIAILSAYESVAEKHGAPGRVKSHTHWKAMSDILLARPRTTTACEVTRGCVYSLSFNTFIAPATRNEASPFEHEYFLRLEPMGSPIPSCPPPDELIRLKRCRFQLQLQLPRLLKETRAIVNDHVAETQRLATQRFCIGLFRHVDVEAETFLLRRVSVLRTLEASHNIVVPFHFDFKDNQEFSDAVAYWHCRLLLIRLYLHLFDPDSLDHIEFMQDTRLQGAFPNRANLTHEAIRMNSNILMSWPYADKYGPMLINQIQQPMLEVWRMIDHVGTGQKPSLTAATDGDQPGSTAGAGHKCLPAEAVKAWIREQYIAADPEIYLWEPGIARFALQRPTSSAARI